MQRNWMTAILSDQLHVWSPTELDSTQSCCHYLLQIFFIIFVGYFFSHPFIPVNALLECCMLFVCFFWLFYDACTSKLIIFPVCICCILFVCFFWLDYKKWINIDHIFPVSIFCILFVHILLMLYTKRIHKNQSHFLCVFSMYML